MWEVWKMFTTSKKPISRWIPSYCTKWRVTATVSFHSTISSTYNFYDSTCYFL